MARAAPRELGETMLTSKLKALDHEFEDRQICAVIVRDGGWDVFTYTLDGGAAMFWVSAGGVEPRAGDAVRCYGGKSMRGVDINGQEVYYRPPASWDETLVGDLALVAEDED